MKITRIFIKNYKSIKEIEFFPNPGINTFIGENSVGKSNIFSAINWILGKSWPTFHQTTINDHFGGDIKNHILIQIDFADDVSFVLDESLEEYNFGIFKGGHKVTKGGNNEFREKYCIGYIDTGREIVDYLPSNRWSLVGRILQEVNTKFCEEEMHHPKKFGEDGTPLLVKKQTFLAEILSYAKNRILFTVKNNKGENIMEKFVDILQTETAAQLNRKKEEFSVDFNLYDPWNFYKTLQILVKEDNGLTFQASQLGMGVQASISIAILKAYAELNLKNSPTIFIDEPELFLHPQAQRNFYNILRELSTTKSDQETGEIISIGTQIFYNTHSPDFLSAGNFNEIFLVRKTPEHGTYICSGDLQSFCLDLEKRTGKKVAHEDYLLQMKNAYDESGDSQKSNEAFFAKKVILVEGQTESWLLPYFFNLGGFDYIKEGITIVRCGCKNEIDRFFRLYVEFGIPCYIIFDGDKQLSGTEQEEKNIQMNKVILGLAGDSSGADYPDNGAHKKHLGFAERIEENLGFAVGNKDKGLEIYKKAKTVITSPAQLPAWVAELIIKIKELKSEDYTSVLLR